MYAADANTQIGTGDFQLTNSLNAIPILKKCPIMMGKCCSVNYFPSNTSQFQYQATSYTGPYAQLGVILTGGVGGTSPSTLEVTIVTNWECIPNAASAGSIEVKPSLCSYKALENAYNVGGTDKYFATFDRDVFNMQNSLTSSSAEEASGKSAMELIAGFLKQNSASAMDIGSRLWTMYQSHATTATPAILN